MSIFIIRLPGIPYTTAGPFFGWNSFAAQIETIVVSIQQKTGKRPLVVGMDQYKTASELAFYRTLRFEHDPHSSQTPPLDETLGRSIWEREAVMYDYWLSTPYDKETPLLVISPDPEELEKRWMLVKTEQIGEVYTLAAAKNTSKVLPLYHRLVNIDDQNKGLINLSNISSR